MLNDNNWRTIMSLDSAMKILLVEDAALMRKMEKKTLNSLGFQNVIDAEDGVDAINKLNEEEDVKLVISDWNMPEKNGFELLVWIRENDKFKNLPFLMATGRGERKEMQKASEAGVSAFIAKPFNAQELKEKIEEAFGQKKDEPKKEKRIPQKTASGKVLIKAGHIQITDHLVLGVLKQLIDSGELNPEHFELETQCMSSWNPVAKSMEEGTLDAACVLAPIAMDLFSYHVPIKLILFAHKNGSIFVRNRLGGQYSEPYHNFFKRKSFYIPHNMSVHNMLAHMFFKGINLKPGVTGMDNVDVAFEVVPPIKMPEFLGSNPDACGYLVAEPLGTKAIANGIAELQFLSSELWENHPCCVIAIQDDLVNFHPEAVYEFTDMLVKSGKFIEKKPGQAAEIAVKFLDPTGTMGLKVPLLKNVLTEPKGIKTGDLFPVVEDLNRIQQYMNKEMGLGNIVDIDKFVDLRFAKKACPDWSTKTKGSNIENINIKAIDILSRGGEDEKDQAIKAMVNKEGKYLTFSLNNRQFGIDILKIREIIGMMAIRPIPQTPDFLKGVINLRGKVIPVIDLRLKFNLEEIPYNDRTCIIVLEVGSKADDLLMGVIVDSVSEVNNIYAKDIEEPPSFGIDTETKYILAIAKTGGLVKILLDMDEVLDRKEMEAMSAVMV